MNVRPVLERELRRASRQSGTWNRRVLSALSVLLLEGLIYGATQADGMTSQAGLIIFVGVTSLMLAQCMVSGASRTADCLSEEKRQGTLGLLFLTPLRPTDIVLGKLFAKGLGGFFGLVATFPILAIALMMGGVHYAEFWRVLCNLLSTLLLSMAAGIYVSAGVVRARVASSVSALLIVSIMLGLPLLALLIGEFSSAGSWSVFIELLSPVYAQRMAFDSSRGLSHNYFWTSLLATQALVAVLLYRASVLLPKNWENVPGRSNSGLGHWAAARYGAKSSRRSFRSRAMDRNPFYWLAAREQLSSAGPRIYFLALAGVVAWLWLDPELDRTGMLVASTCFSGLVLRVWLVSTVCERFAEERQSGAFELLLATPLKVETIVGGQWLALRRRFLPMLVGSFIMEWLVYRVEGGQSDIRVLCAYQILSLFELVAIGWTGMWMALVKAPQFASGAAFWRAYVLPYLMVGIGGFTWMAWLRSHPSQEENGWRIFVVFWLVFVAVWCAAISLWARRRIYEGFRKAASERYQARPNTLLQKVFSDVEVA